MEPLNRLDLEHPLDNNAYEELSPLLGRVYAQQQEIRHRTRDLRQRRDEFEQITGSMREGLVLLDLAGASSASIRRPKHCFMRTVPA
ncbi:MAG: hypothetical protein ACLSHO_14195 [Dysosmobacter sp.]